MKKSAGNSIELVCLPECFSRFVLFLFIYIVMGKMCAWCEYPSTLAYCIGTVAVAVRFQRNYCPRQVYVRVYFFLSKYIYLYSQTFMRLPLRILEMSEFVVSNIYVMG